jgi:hypothetical protein
MNIIRVNFQTYATIVLVLFFSCAAQGQVHPRIPDETIINKGAGLGDLLFVTVRLETGEKLRFIMDTGAPGTLFDKSLEPKLGKRLGEKKIVWSGGKYDAGVYESPKLFLGDTELMTDHWVRTFDFKLLPYPGPPIMGVLGMDCLRHYCIQLDFSARRLRFLEPDNLSSGRWGEAFPLFPYFPLSLRRGTFYVHENLVGAKGANTMIDTGCNYDGELTTKLFQQWTNTSNIHVPGVCFPNGMLARTITLIYI